MDLIPVSYLVIIFPPSQEFNSHALPTQPLNLNLKTLPIKPSHSCKLKTNSSTPFSPPVRELVTPPLDGLILPGVTRDSLLYLARQWGEFEVNERDITMGELVDHSENGRVSVRDTCSSVYF